MYVHEPPGWRLAPVRGDALYRAEYLFTQRMLEDESLRTRSLDQAQLYYVPTWAVYKLGNTAMRGNAFLFGRIVASLRGASEAFNRSWAASPSMHVFFFGGDKGACTVPRGPLFLTHWGLQVPWSRMLAPSQWRLTPSPTEVRITSTGSGQTHTDANTC